MMLAVRVGVACVAVGLAPGAAHADRYEASASIRPSGGVARVPETGAEDLAAVASAGLAASFSWGLRDWLDLGGELATGTLGETRYDRAMVLVEDYPVSGPLRRKVTRLAQLRGVATLRMGVAWIPTVQLAVGAGARQRSSALLRGPSAQGESLYVPDDQDAGVTLDVLASVRVGLDRRLNRSWIVGVSVGASHALGIGAPDLQLADASVTLTRVWYPNW